MVLDKQGQEKVPRAKDVVRRAEQDGEVPMDASTTSGRYGAGVCEQLTLQYLQRGVGWLSADGRECLIWKIEFRRRRHSENGGLSRHSQLKKETGSVDDYP